jgi:hypothetical protein
LFKQIISLNYAVVSKVMMSEKWRMLKVGIKMGDDL